MGTHLLQPLRLDVGDAAPKQSRGFDQFGGDNPATRLFDQMRARMGKKLDGARAQVLAALPFFELATDVAQQTRQHGQVQLLVARGLGVQAPFMLGHHRVQLAVDVLPFPNATDVDEILSQQLFVLAVRQFVRCRLSWESGQPGVMLRVPRPLRGLRLVRSGTPSCPNSWCRGR